MTQIWKCDYCSHTTKDVAKMRTHEDECVWNEKNKTCSTCEHSGGGYSGYMTCDLNIELKSSSGNINCTKWKRILDYSY